MKGTVSTLSFVSLWFALSLSLSFSLSFSLVSPSHLRAGNELPEDILREKGLGDFRGEGKRRKWKVGEREEEEDRPEREGERAGINERNRMNSSRCLLLWIKSSRSAKSWWKLVETRLSPRFFPLLSSPLLSLLCLCPAILSLLKWNKMKWKEGWKRCIHEGLEMKGMENWREARRHC